MRTFTAKDLEQYNGKKGKPDYVAYKGKVHDVTDSFLWKDGKHQVLHTAGTDLTHEIEHAPQAETYSQNSQWLESYRKLADMVPARLWQLTSDN